VLKEKTLTNKRRQELVQRRTTSQQLADEAQAGAGGRIHVLLWNVTLVLVASHLAAAVYHAICRDGVVSRMMPRLR